MANLHYSVAGKLDWEFVAHVLYQQKSKISFFYGFIDFLEKEPMSYAIASELSVEGRHGSQIEGAYWRLRQDIIAGTLAPSQKLRIDFLRKTYGFGASGLREALSRLVSDGLAESEAQRGYWVSPISREDLQDITMARLSIEVDALRQSILYGSLEWEGRVVAARHSLERFEQSMTESSAEAINGWEKANRHFHMALISGCPSRWLLRFTELLYDQSQRYRHRTVLRRAIPRRGLSADHTSIVEATLARDAEKACAGLHAHIQDTARVAEAAIFGAAKGRDPLPAS